MISNDNFRVLTNEEASKYKFDFCNQCKFYECELVGEYTQFCESRQIHKSQDFQNLTYVETVPLNNNNENMAEATEVWLGDKLVGKCMTFCESPQIHELQGYTYAVAEPVSGSESTENVVEATAVWAGNGDIQNGISSNGAPNSGIGGRLTYDQEELKDGCIMSRRYVQQIECGRKRVTEGIGDHYKIEMESDSSIKIGNINRWEPTQAIFISAQTGQGKNYFIENELIPYMRELNHKNLTHHKVLILSNRVALKQQIVKRIKENDDSDNEDEAIYLYGEFADAMTYQSLLYNEKHLEKKQKNNKLKYIYVICDEAHFFTSDAAFNPHTQRILTAIIRIFQNAIRVYMSATPNECLKYIVKYENEFQGALNSGREQDKWKYSTMALYHFKRDYSYLDIMYYSDIQELYKEIVSSVNEKKKRWLIFIDDREKCEKVKKELEKCGKENDSPLVIESNDANTQNKTEIVFAVNADSKKNQDYISMVKNERLNKDTYVLITTSVLDNGINLTNIDNIVVSDMEKVKCLQMVGRARVKGVDDRKNLYIKRFDSKYVEDRIKDYMRQGDAYYSYRKAYGELPNMLQRRGYDEYAFLDKYYNGDDKDWKNAKHWFGRSFDKPTELYLNEIAYSMMNRLYFRYQTILDEMLEESDEAQNQEEKNRIGQKYLEHQLSWFGKKYCPDNDITFADKEKRKEEFVAFFEAYVKSGEQILKGTEEDKEFTAKFIELFDAAYYKSDKNNRNYGADKMNRLLKQERIGYKIEGKPQSGPWTIIRFDWNERDKNSETK